MNDAMTKIYKLLSVDKIDYKHCIDHVDHDETIDGVKTTIRLHYVKFDANGKPMLGALAETLYDYIIHYCIAARNRDDMLTPTQATRLTKDAKELFIHPEATEDDPDQTGEAGEILLYFLVESILEAPQVVSKMELKTSQNKEVHGSDGIHMRWCKNDGIVDVYFGEAKIHQSLSGALGSAFKSISGFHEEGMYKHEFLMVTKHFKYADEAIKSEVKKLIVRGEPSSDVRINHACLIGYNWDKYKELLENGTENIEEDFRQLFIDDAPRVVTLLKNRFDGFDKKHLRFDFFFIPFVHVQEFRDAFNKALD
ncbi:MAG: DUF1837 domain-containing protein [Candidatus Thiodiazotropha endolucinida]|nr:DUF1837 domain-containing protein [Candidatus Thiodiazotropha endolucinida]